jgi:hypothetical protein
MMVWALLRIRAAAAEEGRPTQDYVAAGDARDPRLIRAVVVMM